jgi:protein ImuB
MPLWIGLHLSRLPLEVFEPNWSSDSVAVVLDQGKALGVSLSASAAGIKLGMRRGGILMLDQDVRIYVRSPRKEREAMDAAAMALLQYTPIVAEAEEFTLLMDIGGSLRLFGGIRSLCRRVRSDLRVLGFTASISCAPTARAAWLFARCGGSRVLKYKTMVCRLDKLPVLAIPAARPYASWFEGLGCKTIAHLRRLPRPGLQRRCGSQLRDTIDSALGESPELFAWIEAPTTFEAKIELFGRIENADLLLAGAQRLVMQLIGWLHSKQLAAKSVMLQLQHERGRTARAPTPVEIVLVEPVWQGEHIIRLLKERLNKLELEAPVIGLTLETIQLQPLALPTLSLFPEPSGSVKEQARVIELIIARLGADAVRQAKPIADYRPEVANAWVTVQEAVRDAAVTTSLPPNLNSIMRPTWLLEKPIALLVRNHRPFYGSPLRMVSGPERIEAGWWDATATRDYWVAEGQEHALYWIYRERIHGISEKIEQRWFLHGLFG